MLPSLIGMLRQTSRRLPAVRMLVDCFAVALSKARIQPCGLEIDAVGGKTLGSGHSQRQRRAAAMGRKYSFASGGTDHSRPSACE